LICKSNGKQLKVWTKSGYWDQRITDEDMYYALNWKLVFATSDECVAWLLQYGFKEPKYGLLDLADAAARMLKCPANQTLNAGFNNHYAAKLTGHFFPHYWHSTHVDYMPPSRVWQPGNHMVLKSAMAELWEKKREINIYGLLKHVAKFYKDFATVSLFKPWIAAHVYNRYLPHGGTVVDPCCGWGGRLMGCADRDIKYVGYDLNQYTVDSHTALTKFLGRRLPIAPEFYQADATNCDVASGDMLFTSPPYDNTELYHGINSNQTTTAPILENIFSKFSGMIILNIPKRLEQTCVQIASARNRVVVERLEMMTGSFMGRSQTVEPILVFK